MEKIKVFDLLKEKDYYNVIISLIAASYDKNPTFLIKALGESGAFDELRKSLTFKSFADQYTDLSFNPIGLTPNGYIYRDHFQVTGAMLSGKFELTILRKKIPCDYTHYNSAWAEGIFSNEEMAEINRYYDKILLEIA